jgi:DNA polymerase-3 subunit beta
MKFSTTQSVILKALTLVFGGIAKSQSDLAKSQDYSLVKIKADKALGNIMLETKNFDVKIKSFFNSQVENSGEVFVEFIKLNEIIKKLNPSNDVLLEVKDLTLNIKNGKSKFSLKAIESIIEDEDRQSSKGTSFKIMSKKVLSLIDKTKFSIYHDEVRFNLNGLSFQFKETDATSFLTTVSTDGHRLSFCKLEASIPEQSKFLKIILPKKSTIELCKILEQVEDEELEINLLEKQITFSCNSFSFVSKLIDAEFPEYEKVIPQENTKITTISRKEFMTLIERVATIHAGSSENSIKLTFSHNLLTILAKNKDTGEAVDEISTESSFEDVIEVNYNYSYLLEILAHISSDKLLFCLKDERTPALIKDEKLDSYFYILMPMRF